jgi:Tfp pilus assembly protein PilF
MNQPQRAEKEFKSALAIDPTYGDANYNLAILYATWQPPKWDDARSNYQQALEKGVKPNPDLEKMLQVPAATPPAAEPPKAVSAG